VAAQAGPLALAPGQPTQIEFRTDQRQSLHNFESAETIRLPAAIIAIFKLPVPDSSKSGTGSLMPQGADSGIYYYLEVVTASQQIVPCLRLYTQWAKQDDISLSDAVDLFLSL